jgi:hypothetical protein
LLHAYTNNTTMALNLLLEWEDRINDNIPGDNIDLQFSIDDVTKCILFLIIHSNWRMRRKVYKILFRMCVN